MTSVFIHTLEVLEVDSNLRLCDCCTTSWHFDSASVTRAWRFCFTPAQRPKKQPGKHLKVWYHPLQGLIEAAHSRAVKSLLSANALQARHCVETIPEVIYVRFFFPFWNSLSSLFWCADPCWYFRDLRMTQPHLKDDRTGETTVRKEENNEGTEFKQRSRFYRHPWQKQNFCKKNKKTSSVMI